MRWRALDTFVDVATAVTFVVMTLALGLQVVFRYVLNRPLVWSEELSLLFFVWFVFLGGSAGMRDERQIRVDVIDTYAPRAVRRVLEPVLTVLSLAFLAVVVFYGVKVTRFQTTAEYDVLPVSRAAQYAVAPVIGSLMILSLLRVLVRQLRRRGGDVDRDGAR
jgi:TRAP-type C4-dicarboxylate transport system permease small subunit